MRHGATVLALALAALLALASLACAKDLYGILGLERDATDAEIKKAFRRLSLKYHPDKNPGDEEAARRFVDIGEAHDVLSNPDKRTTFDLDGYEALSKQAQRAGSPLDMFFGHGHGAQGGRPRGPDARVDMAVSLEQLYLGSQATIQIERAVLCAKCRGSGAKGGDTKPCAACAGRGVVNKVQTLGPGFQVQMQAPCDACGGRGNIPKTACPVCGGKKVQREKKSLTAVVEKGMRDGATIVFARESEQSPTTTPGDVIVTLRQQPHARLRREGDDLHAELSIPLKDALLGFSRTVKQLDGRDVSVGRTGVTQPFDVLRVRGEGMPMHDSPSDAGDLLVKVTTVLPVLNAKQREAIAALL